MTVFAWSDYPDIDEFILANRASGVAYAEISDLVFERFGVALTPNQISGRYTRIRSSVAPAPVRRGPSLQQVYKNHVKTVRMAIRHKHSIAADNELEQVLPLVKAELDKQLQEGAIRGLSVGEMLALIEG